MGLGGTGNAAASASVATSIALGNAAISGGANSIVIGTGALDQANANATVLGNGASITSGLSGSNVALGQGSIVTTGGQSNYNAFGLTAAQSSAGSVSIGTPATTRTLSNLAAGRAATDAVNVAQLSGTATNLGGVIATGLGGAGSYDAGTGQLIGLRYTVGGKDYGNVGAALAASSALGVQYTPDLNGAPTPAIDLTKGVAQAAPVSLSGLANATTATGAVALGQLALRYTDAGGISTPATPSNTVSLVGAAAGTVTLSNLAAGRAATDAVNVAQLTGAAANLGGSLATTLGGSASYDPATGLVTGPSYTVGTKAYATVASAIAAGNTLGVQYTADANGNPTAVIDLTKGIAQAAPVSLRGLAAGAVIAGSTQAITGGQLLATAQSVSAALGGKATVAADGTLTAPAYDVAGIPYATVGSALAALDTNIAAVKLGGFAAGILGGASAPVASGTGASAGGFGAVASGAGSTVIGSLALDNGIAGSTVLGSEARITAGLAGTNVALGQGSVVSTGAQVNYGAFGLTAPQTSAGTVSVGAANAARTVSNLAAGVVGTDAVNVAQLSGAATNLGGAIAAGLGGTAGYNVNTGLITGPQYTVGGKVYTSVGSALAAGAALGVQYTADGNGVPTAAIDLTKGNPQAPVTLSGLANATGATGAVALGQLPVQFTTAGLVTPGLPSNTVALVGAATGQAVGLTNVAAGVLSATSTDAVNGAQLNATNQLIAGITVGQSVVFQSNNAALGLAPNVSGRNASAGGFGAVVAGAGSTVIGNAASDNGVDGSTSLGNGARIEVGLTGSSVALGQNSVAMVGRQTNYGAFGLTQKQNAAGTVSIGDLGSERTLSNVAAGLSSTDAVNVAQLAGVSANLGGALATGLGGSAVYDATTGQVTAPRYTVAGNVYGNVGDALAAGNKASVQYTTTAAGNALSTIDLTRSGTLAPVSMTGLANASLASGAVTLGQLAIRYTDASGNPTPATPSNTVALVGAAAGTSVTIGNVAAGAVGATSLQAVNGSQLFGTAQSVSAALGGGATLTTDGTLKVPSYTVAGAAYHDVGSAVAALDTSIASGRLGAFVADNTAGKAGPAAGGANASAGGFGSVASGAGSTAIGNSALDNGVAGSTVLGSAARITAGLTGSNVALGQNSVASTGAQSNYAAFGLTSRQSAAGTVSVGAVGAERTISNVAAGVAGTDAANVAQLTGAATNLGGSVAAGLGGGAAFDPATGRITAPTYTVGGKAYGDVGSAIAAGTALGVQYTPDANGNATSAVDLTKSGALAPVKLSGLQAGTVGATSTDAVNGSQLYATNQTVANLASGKGGAFVSDNTSGAALPAATGADAAAGGFGALASGGRSVALGAGSASSGTNSVALGAGSTDGGVASVVSVGAAGTERRITNVAAGLTPTDAANTGQLTALAARSLQYDTTAGGATNYQAVTLNPTGSGPVTIHNVAPGLARTDAVNVGQLSAATVNAVQYGTNPDGTRSNTLSLMGGTAGAPVAVSNVAAGVAPTDAVNVAQLQGAMNGQFNNLAQIGEYQFRSAKQTAYAGTSIALATAGIRYDDRPGKISLGLGASGYHGSAGLAVGLGGTSEDGKWRINVSAGFSPNNQKGAAGFMGGASYTFN